MNGGQEIFKTLQNRARTLGPHGAAPTQEYLVRHLLESFLSRLTRTDHGDDFVLKGGALMAAYGIRRPTKDADTNAVNADVTAEHLTRVLADVAGIMEEDGVLFNLDTVDIRQIRDQAGYPGRRVQLRAQIGPWTGTTTWDVSTGDPIMPPAQRVTIKRLLGRPIRMLGYAPETVIAEKGVTILERGITSTRWRDYVDIVQLASAGFDPMTLRRAAEAVAQYRGVNLGPVSPHLEGYAAVGQAKWTAWRRKHRLEMFSEESLTDQVGLVAAYLDPVFN